MSKSSKWRDKLLSSGVPLEFEAGKILVDHGFAIDSDYLFSRNYDGLIKDSSIDILATGYMPLDDRNNTQAVLHILVECKYRSPQISWMFLPEINDEDFAQFNLDTIRVRPEFSAYTMDNDNIRNLFLDFEGCYKGVEIDLENGAVHDSEIKRGINQLRYALPRLYSESILHNAYNHPDDSVPLLFCPILLTNAPLHVLRYEAKIVDVIAAKTIEDLSSKQKLIEIYSDYGPDFKRHCKDTCTELKDLKKADRNKIFTRRTAQKIDKYDFSSPLYLSFDLATGERSFLKRNFTQFIICDLSYFSQFLDTIKDKVNEDLKSIKQVIFKE